MAPRRAAARSEEGWKRLRRAKASAKQRGSSRHAFPAGEPPQHRPQISTYAGYVKAEETSEHPSAARQRFSPHLAVFTLEREDGPYRQLDLACTLALTDRWREALASHANDLSPEAQRLITGHAPAAHRCKLRTPHFCRSALSAIRTRMAVCRVSRSLCRTACQVNCVPKCSVPPRESAKKG